MSVLVAIDLGAREAQVVTAEPLHSGRFRILGYHQIPIERKDAEPVVSNGADEAAPTEQAESIEQTLKLIPLPPDEDIEAALAVSSHYPVFSEILSLPFKDQKTLEQVAPLQLQDLVPFDTSEFVTDTIVLSRSRDDQNEILASMLPINLVAEDISIVQKLGVDPKLLSTKASVFTSLVSFLPAEENKNFILVFSSLEQCSLAIIVDGAAVFIREFFGDFEHRHVIDRTIRDILATTFRFEHELAVTLESAWVGGNHEVCQAIANTGRWQTKQIDLSSFYDISPNVTIPNKDISWALALFTAELENKDKTSLVNFRRGKFAYRPFLNNLLTALKEEMWWIIYAAFFAFLWVGTLWYTNSSKLSTIEDAISKETASAIPGESLTKGTEAQQIQDKIAAVEEQLSDLGSLSSLSPLESLKELSEAINNSIDVSIDSINIGHKGLSIRGTVLDIPTSGKLNTALSARKDRFCNVSVNTRGNIPGAGRLRFEAEVDFCE